MPTTRTGDLSLDIRKVVRPLTENVTMAFAWAFSEIVYAAFVIASVELLRQQAEPVR